MSVLMKHIHREQELYDEILNLKKEIHGKRMELERLEKQLSDAENKRKQIRKYMSDEIWKILRESE